MRPEPSCVAASESTVHCVTAMERAPAKKNASANPLRPRPLALPSDAAVLQADKITRFASSVRLAIFVAVSKPCTTTTPEALKAFNDATADYERKKARVTKLLKMSVSAA